MISNYDAFIAHLKRTGRMKLLPQVLWELKNERERSGKLTLKKETAEDNPALISGWRTLENGILTDHTGKSALIAIYKKITNA